MAKIALSDMTVKNLPLPERGQRAYWDENLAGFGVRVSQGGAKTFIVLDPRAKVRVAESIGRYGRISLQDARQEAKRRLAEATLGKSRARPIRANKAVELYLKETRLKPRSRKDYTLILNRLKMGETKLSDVSPDDLEKRLAGIPGGFPVARGFFKWAYRKRYVEESPLARMKAPARYASRERTLTDDELKKIWDACPEGRFGRLVRLSHSYGAKSGGGERARS